jgi:hypothetical protein
MSEPIKNARIVKAPEFTDKRIRRWREGEQVKGRDNRPGYYSVTGTFVVLPDSQRNSSESGGQAES